MNYFELKSKLVSDVLWSRFSSRDYKYQSNALNIIGIIESELVPYQKRSEEECKRVKSVLARLDALIGKNGEKYNFLISDDVSVCDISLLCALHLLPSSLYMSFPNISSWFKVTYQLFACLFATDSG